MRHTRRSVIARTRREFAALDRLVAGLRPADWQRRVPRSPTRDPWTVKDALAHIVYWKAHTARVIRGERRLPEMRGLDVNAINRLIYRRWRRRPPRAVLAWHREVHADVLRTLARRPPGSAGGSAGRGGPATSTGTRLRIAGTTSRPRWRSRPSGPGPGGVGPLDRVGVAWENPLHARK
jgi:hypothetical protein